MGTIDSQSTMSSITGGDKLLAWSTSNGDMRKVSITVLMDFIRENLGDAVADTLVAGEYVKVTAVAVASLPSASLVGAGSRASVTNATQTLTAGIGATVVGGGANIVPVFSDGTNWKIG